MGINKPCCFILQTSVFVTSPNYFEMEIAHFTVVNKLPKLKSIFFYYNKKLLNGRILLDNGHIKKRLIMS